jgi:predicted transcriptional regulator of viral defense system
MDQIDQLVSAIAEGHHGIFGAHHLEQLRVSAHERHYRLRIGRWIAVHDGAYRSAGAPLTWHGRVLAACWAGGVRAAASHRTAAELWALPGRDPALVEVTCPRWHRARHEGLVVHESLALDEIDVTTRDGIPVTKAARTLFDLAGLVGKDLREGTVDLAIDNAFRRNLTTTADLQATLDRLARRGRAGSGRLRQMLRDRNPAVTESEAERRVLRIFHRHGLPSPVVQYEIRDDADCFVARVDFAYPDLKIAIEYDSYEHHIGTVAHDHDGDRRNAILGAGWYPITATAAHLRGDGSRLALDVRRARTQRSGVATRE